MVRTTLIAHRGASGYAPENTFAAFDLALEQGADVLELDVRVTADNDLLALHDPTLERTTGDPRRHDQLVDLPDHPAAPPTLDAVFARYGAGPRYLIDLKDPLPRWERRVVDAIERHGLQERCMVQSFDLVALARLHREAPWLPISALYRRATSLELDPVDVPRFACAVGAWHVVVDEVFVARARARGLAIHPYTVDDADEAARLVQLGVDGVITNVPDAVADAVHHPAPRAA